jgi:transcription elongation factor GreA
MRLPTRKKELERMQSEELDVLVTQEKLDAMVREVERLTKTERGPAAEEVARTAAMGDLSENAGYQWAKQNLRRINGRILTLTDKIQRAVVINKNTGSAVVRIGSTVTIRSNGKSMTYEILGSQESNPFKGRISHSSPIGKALLGSRVGEVVPVTIGGKTTEYTVESIQ